MKYMFILLILIHIGFSAQARDLIVDNSKEGDNLRAKASSTSSLIVPFKTIQEAVDIARAGDRVLISSGTYNEFVTVRHSGFTDSRLIIKSFSNYKEVWLKGKIQVQADYITIEGLNIDGRAGEVVGLGKASGAASIAGIDIQGFDVNIINNNIKDVDSYGISAGSGGTVRGNYIYKCQKGISTGSNSLIDNNEIERLWAWRTNMDCDYMRGFGSNMTIRNNYMHGTSKSEVADAHVDCFQTFYSSYSNMIYEQNSCNDMSQGLIFEPNNSTGTSDKITGVYNSSKDTPQAFYAIRDYLLKLAEF